MRTRSTLPEEPTACARRAAVNPACGYAFQRAPLRTLLGSRERLIEVGNDIGFIFEPD